MGHAIGQVLPLAVRVALSPVPIIAVMLILVAGYELLSRYRVPLLP